MKENIDNLNDNIHVSQLLCLFKDCPTVSLIPAIHYVVLSTVTSLLRKSPQTGLVWPGKLCRLGNTGHQSGYPQAESALGSELFKIHTKFC